MKANELEELLTKVEKLSKGGRVNSFMDGDRVVLSVQHPIKDTTWKSTRATGKGASTAPSKKATKGLLLDKRGGRFTRKKDAGVRYMTRNPAFEIKLGEIEISDEEVEERFQIAIEDRQVGYLAGAKLMQIGASRYYELVEDYPYEVDYFAVKRSLSVDEIRAAAAGKVPHLATIIAKSGFRFDRASIPRAFWWIISKDDLSNVPPLFHDLLYRFAGKLPKNHVDPYTIFTRDEADNLFKHLMERSGVSEWRTGLAFQAVKRFGKSSWALEPWLCRRYIHCRTLDARPGFCKYQGVVVEWETRPRYLLFRIPKPVAQEMILRRLKEGQGTNRMITAEKRHMRCTPRQKNARMVYVASPTIGGQSSVPTGILKIKD